MYIEIGSSKQVRLTDIIGVFDTDKTTVMKSTRDYLNNAQKNDEIVLLTDDIPKSFIVTSDKENDDDSFEVYLSALNTSTIIKRV